MQRCAALCSRAWRQSPACQRCCCRWGKGDAEPVRELSNAFLQVQPWCMALGAIASACVPDALKAIDLGTNFLTLTLTSPSIAASLPPERTA